MTDWYHCYGESWTSIIEPESFCHPAKFSRALIRRIYRHAIEEGWLAAGDVVVDPFGGVALGALHAMKHGLRWIGVELEEKFVGLGRANIEKWAADFGPHFQGWGRAQLIQGDSRELARVVGEAALCVSSPPYSESLSRDTVDPAARRRVARNLGIANCEHVTPIDMEKIGKRNQSDYGSSPGQLAALPEGDLDACISSPPFLGSGVGGTDNVVGKNTQCVSRNRPPDVEKHGNLRGLSYGETIGQLAAMPEGAFADGVEAVISSPPYESCPIVQRADGDIGGSWRRKERETGAAKGKNKQYNQSNQMNLGSDSGATFWSASRVIVEQVYQVLKPGGVAIWVTKAFVRNKQRVDFPGQWRQLCEAVGFETLHEHRAWLVEDRGAQYDLMGELHEHTVERKSFFRRLAEQKGSPRIDWETVLCMRKPMPGTVRLAPATVDNVGE